METLRPLILMSFMAAGICGLLLGLAQLLGPRNRNPVKDAPFECGNLPFSTPKGRFPVKFYKYAMLFIIFDIELMFLLPWAVIFKDQGKPAFYAMSVFLVIVCVGFLYEWRKGAMEWD
jgi:NADH-quinone oxidoreductase subunit A